MRQDVPSSAQCREFIYDCQWVSSRALFLTFKKYNDDDY